MLYTCKIARLRTIDGNASKGPFKRPDKTIHDMMCQLFDNDMKNNHQIFSTRASRSISLKVVVVVVVVVVVLVLVLVLVVTFCKNLKNSSISQHRWRIQYTKYCKQLVKLLNTVSLKRSSKQT